MDETVTNAVKLSADLTIAWLRNTNNRSSADAAPAFLRMMHDTIAAMAIQSSSTSSDTMSAPRVETFIPATTVRKSLASRDHIISLINGKPYRSLRLHLSRHGLTPEQYRDRYGLKDDYPMVAEGYSEQRREMARQIGLGQMGRAAKAAARAAAARGSLERPKRKAKLV